VGLTGTRVTDKDNVSLLGNKVTGQTIINKTFIDRRLKRKIKVLDVFMSRKFGSRISFFEAIGPPIVLFVF